MGGIAGPALAAGPACVFSGATEFSHRLRRAVSASADFHQASLSQTASRGVHGRGRFKLKDSSSKIQARGNKLKTTRSKQQAQCQQLQYQDLDKRQTRSRPSDGGEGYLDRGGMYRFRPPASDFEDIEETGGIRRLCRVQVPVSLQGRGLLLERAYDCRVHGLVKCGDAFSDRVGRAPAGGVKSDSASRASIGRRSLAALT